MTDIMEPSTHFTFQIPERLAEWARERAILQDRSLASYIRCLILKDKAEAEAADSCEPSEDG